MSTVTGPSPPRPGRQRLTGRLATGLLVAVAVAVAACGPVVGALWAWLSPRGQAVVGPGGVYVADTESQAAIASDGYFAVLGIIAGLGCGVVAFLATRGRGVVAALALPVGGCAGSALAWWTGAWLGPEEVRIAARGADVGARLELPLEIGAPGVLMTWPIAAVAVLLVLTATFDRVEPAGAWREPGPSGYRSPLDRARGG